VSPRGRQETILIVDDENALRKSLELVLRAFNYDVLSAADGKEALRLFEENEQRIRLVFTDLMMPGMSGFALIRAIRPRAPHLPIVATSGLEREGYTDELANFGVGEVLRKPFRPEEILELLHRLLAPK
jgi:CheY-like chemotaxis protein